MVVFYTTTIDLTRNTTTLLDERTFPLSGVGDRSG
jgi:hypothetical protein